MKLPYSTAFRNSIAVILICWAAPMLAQDSGAWVFPDYINWNVINEGETLEFTLAWMADEDESQPMYALIGAEGLGVQFDSLGHFRWTPDFKLVDRLEEKKEFPMIFEAFWPGGRRTRQTINFVVRHGNRPPVVEELPVFYVRQAVNNTYQIPTNEYVYDPDGDPLVFKAIPSQMPEGAMLSAKGLLTWRPSRNQFYQLSREPLMLEFIVQDQPEKAEAVGKIKITPTQLDLPPEILIVPGDTAIVMKEDEVLSLKIYVSDPNGDDNILNVDFVCSDLRVPRSTLKENTPTQWEFMWTPGYQFVDEAKKQEMFDLLFFAVDKAGNRTVKKVEVTVLDTENLLEKDKDTFEKYRETLVAAMDLIAQLDENQKHLNNEYRKAKKGKKNRAILNASLGAVTGISPVFMEAESQRMVSGIGGTTVLTLGTLEATEVLGKSKNEIMEKLRVNMEIRGNLQLEGDNFARKYALKSSRRGTAFLADLDKLRAQLNHQKLVFLELDAGWKNSKQPNDKNLKKAFPDFAPMD
jgi:hypothetical protein